MINDKNDTAVKLKFYSPQDIQMYGAGGIQKLMSLMSKLSLYRIQIVILS